MTETPRTDDPSDDAPLRDLARITTIVEDLRVAVSADDALWRVPDDAVDQTYDKLVDRIVDGSPPRAPRSWAWRVLMNSLKSGPARSELRSRDMSDLPASVTTGDPVAETDRQARRMRQLQVLEQLGGEVLLALTESEQAAFRALLTEPTMKAAAQSCRMSKRDLRVRRKWIVKKIRCLLKCNGGTTELAGK